jgi:NAD(P)-dependent dehydrogenase (short-subunit alcohol dehydrogenase family)
MNSRKPMMPMLANKLIVVTGAGRGIGQAIAAACAHGGAKVLLVDRLASEVTAAAQSLREQGADAEAHVADLCDGDAVAALFKGVLQRQGRIDGLVNNAGTTVYGGALDTGLDELMRVLHVHLAPTLLCTQAVAPAMLAAGRGRIVHMASAAAEAAVTRLFGYSMAKAAIVSMTQHMAAEFGNRGVTVNALAPGPVLTEALRANQNPAVQQALRQGIPADRFAEPAEVAGAAVFLLSDPSSYVNGHVLTVDGGLMSLRTPLHRLVASATHASTPP